MKNKNGFVIWVTGISGSGKTSISKLILRKFTKRYGPTVIFQGDDLRKIFKLKSFTKDGRISNAFIYSDLIKKISDQGINIIISVIGMFDVIRDRNRRNIKNYIEVFVKCDLKKIIKRSKKKHYRLKKNVMGIDIMPEFPKKPEIIVKNDFKRNLKTISKEVLNKIEKIISEK